MASDAQNKTIRGRIPNGPKIRELRINRGWSVEEFAKRADLAPATIQSVERGDSSKFLSTFASIATALEVSPSELYHEESASLSAHADEQNGNKVALAITIVTITLGEVDDSKPLPKPVRDIIEAFGGDHNVRITRLTAGSVVLELEAAELPACYFLDAFCAGEFYPHVSHVTCTDSPAIRQAIATVVDGRELQPHELTALIGYYTSFLKISSTEIARLDAFIQNGTAELTMYRIEPSGQQAADSQPRRSQRQHRSDK